MKRVLTWLIVLSVILCVAAVSETSTIQKGCSGGTVTAIQKILCSLNYLSEEYVTGNYDDMTELAVLAFQLDHGIAPTGIADYETQQAITGSMKTTEDNGQPSTEDAAVDNDETITEPYNDTSAIPTADDVVYDTETESSEEMVTVKLSSGKEVAIRKSVKDAIDAYEAFMDSYYEAMSGLGDGDFTGYMAFMEQYSDTVEKMEDLEDDLTDQESMYYLEVSTRILQKSYDYAS